MIFLFLSLFVLHSRFSLQDINDDDEGSDEDDDDEEEEGDGKGAL